MLNRKGHTLILSISIIALFSLIHLENSLAADVKLAWDANTDAILAGYKVYSGPASRSYGTPVDVGNIASFTVTGLGQGPYYFAVTAYSIFGEESGFSNEVTTTVTGSDTTAPAIAISVPTSNATYSTGSSPLNLSGTASDNVAVTQVTWVNNRGGSGSATGTGSWSVTGIPLQSGSNILTVTARDAAGNTGTDMLTVTYTPSDTTSPAIAITAPTSNATYSTGSSPLNLSGTASDNVAVTQVTWVNNRGGSGTATGTGSWSVGGIVLQSGSNILTVTARDAAGNTGTDILTVTYTPSDTTSPAIAISAPTLNATYSTGSSPLNLSGTASDNVAVTQVTWVNNRGGSGTATGTGSWSVTSITLQSGSNILTVTARDAAGNTGTDTLTVTFTPTDTTRPTIAITAPTSNATYGTSSSPLNLSGTASDNVAVTQVTWVNNRGGSGTATGTGSWSVTSINLQSGSNVLTVTARDAAGNTGTDTLTVTFTPTDTTRPTIAITAPTSNATYGTSSSPLNLSGTASDNVAVTQVTWVNSRGGSGTATGTGSWSVTSINLQSGSNVLTVTAHDAADNKRNDRLTITYTPTDTTPPAISGVSASGMTSASAAISWTTNESCDSQVEYGTTTAYGSSTALDSTMVSAHSEVLSGLMSGTAYHYRAKSRDAAGNLATSGDFSFITDTVAAAIPAFVQRKDLLITSGPNVSATFTSANTTGNLIVAYVVWDNSGSVSLSDSRGNAYSSAIGPTKYSGDRTNAQVFYAKNIAGGTNTVTATFATTITAWGILYIHEYSGIDPSSPIEAAVTASGSSSAMNSGNLTTLSANDLLFAGGESSSSITNAGSGYTVRSTSYGNMTEDRIASTAGSYSATATQNGSAWVLQLVAFKAATSQTVQTMMALPLLTGSEIQSMPAADRYVGVALVNSSTETATVKFTAVDTMGNTIAGTDISNPVVRDLKPGEQLATADKQLFGSALSGALSRGYIKIESSTPKIGGYFAIFNSDLSVYKGATLSTEPLKSIILPEIAELGNTKITAANASSQSGVMSVDLIADNGIIRSSVDRFVRPNGAVIADLAADLFPNIVPEVTDYIRIRTTEGLQVFELLQKRTGNFEILGGQNQGAGAKTLYAPQYLFGPGAKSVLSIVNLDSEGGRVTLRLVGAHARQIGVTRDLPIAPNGKIYIDDPQFFQTSQPANEMQGYLEISSDGVRLTGNLTFIDGKRQASSFSLPLTANLKNSVLFSNAGQNGICSAAVVLLNPGDTVVTAKVELYSGDGRLLAAAADVIPPHARSSRSIADYFPGITGPDWISGYIKIVTNLPIAAFSLLGNSDSSILSVIPSQDIP